MFFLVSKFCVLTPKKEYGVVVDLFKKIGTKQEKNSFGEQLLVRSNDKDYSKLRLFKHSATRVRANWINVLPNYEQ